jgi:hypothetical protein
MRIKKTGRIVDLSFVLLNKKFGEGQGGRWIPWFKWNGGKFWGKNREVFDVVFTWLFFSVSLTVWGNNAKF